MVTIILNLYDFGLSDAELLPCSNYPTSSFKFFNVSFLDLLIYAYKNLSPGVAY